MSRSAAAMRPGPAAVQDVLEHGPVLAGQLVGGRRRLDVGQGLGLDPEGLAGPRDPGPDGGALHTLDGHGGQAAGQVALLHHLGDHADLGEAALDVRDQQQAAARGPGRLDGRPGLVRLERHGEDHARQHDPGFEGEQWECHVLVRHRVCVLL